MKIGYDIDSLTIKSGGIGRYAVNLINNIAKILLGDDRNTISIFYHKSFNKDLINKHSHVRFIDKYTHIKSNVLRKGIFLPFCIRDSDMNLFHGLDHVGIPFLYKAKKCRYVVTIHDLITKIYPDKFTMKHKLIQNNLLPLILGKADKIIAVSNSTKNDIIKFYPEYIDKIKVIHEGVEPQFFPRNEKEIKEKLNRYKIDFKYILLLGTLEPRKNILRAIDAFIKLKQNKDIEEKLVIVGRKGWLYKEILERINEMSFSSDVVFPGFVEDDDLPFLYSGAEIFLYPSLYEGFGLPILEAMACGTPIITSEYSSLPEVAGNAAILIDSTKTEEIAKALERLSGNRGLREELRKKGLKRAENFSWEKTAEKTLKLYEETFG